MYKIVEIFESLQGEGYNVGKKVIFIRFALCNLNCAWCDTDFESVIKHLSIDDIMNELKKYKTKNVIITGGEPTQQNLSPILEVLKLNDYWIGIETNGTNNIINKNIDYIATSPKRNERINLSIADEVRIVYDTNNIDEMMEFCLKVRNEIKAKRYYLSPVEIEKEFQNLEKLIILRQLLLEKGQEWEISLQIHKLINIE